MDRIYYKILLRRRFSPVRRSTRASFSWWDDWNDLHM